MFPILDPMTIMADPAASTWIKTALALAIQRDPVDAANDAEVLAEVLKDRADRILAQSLASLNGNQTGRKCIQCGIAINEHGLCGCEPLDNEAP